MDDRDWLAERFEAHRPRLRAVAWRLLGSAAEADDAVQEAWLRLSRTDPQGIDNLGGWLTTVVARVCLDMLRARGSRREEPLEDGLPDRVVDARDRVGPEEQALLADSVGPAMLVVLDTLAPAERVAFVLHDLFAVPFEEIAPLVGRSAGPAAGSRARRRRRRGPIGAGSGRWWRRSWPPPARVTSRRCWPCSTPRWSSAPTPPAGPGWSAGRRPRPPRRSASPGGLARPARCW